MLNKANCTACGACKNICPQNAIQMKEDAFGFVYPQIIQDLCNNCSLCHKTCDKLAQLERFSHLKAYALQSLDEKLLLKSSSGGIFSELSKCVLDGGGVVFGAAMDCVDEEFFIGHISINSKDELYKLQGSKYVQSDIGETYSEAKKFLEEGKTVLYSGTPCQIGGLKAFLNKEYDKLLTVDLSCTGVPNQKIFNDYIRFLNKNEKKAVTDFKFRNKEMFGWNCGNYLIKNENQDAKVIQGNTSSYHYLFIHGGILRMSCHNCKYANMERVADITMGDCWGIDIAIKEILKENGGKLDREKGISLVLINTTKGMDFLNAIKENLLTIEIDINKVRKYNGPLNAPLKLTEQRENYLNAYINEGYEQLDKLFKRNMGLLFHYSKLKNLTPKWLKKIIKHNFVVTNCKKMYFSLIKKT